MSIGERVREVQEKIARAENSSGRPTGEVKLIAVSKKVSPEKIREAHAAGLRDFAENYVQESLLKMSSVNDLEMRWHMIGHLQTNKVKSIANRFALIQSVDSEKLVDEIEKRSERPQEILVEVNLSEEETKTGMSARDLKAVLQKAQASPRILIRGLMFMPPFDLSPIEQSRYFEQARELRDKMGREISAPHNLNELSMGTSHDFEIAVREGATMVRLGTVIFGPRT